MNSVSSKIMNILKKFFGKKSDGTGSEDEQNRFNVDLSNQTIYDEMVKLFESKLKEMSVGERMIYPMTFNILLHDDDYKYLRASLPLVFKEIIKKFGEIIRKYTAKYPDNLNPAKQWTFQVAGSSDDIPLGNGDVLEVKKGSINVMEVGLFYEDMASVDNDTSNNVRVTLKPRNSKVYKNQNLNMDVYYNIFPISEGVMQFPFDKSILSSNPNNVNNSTANSYVSPNEDICGDGRQTIYGSGNATLSYTLDGSVYTYQIKSALTHISGEDDMRTDDSIFHLKSKNIRDSHVQIRFNQNEKRYQIIAYGPTRLNEKKMHESSGADDGWVTLPNKSSILVNDEICLKFLMA